MKRAYYLAYPDKPLQIVIKDDGEHQEVLTSDSVNLPTWTKMLEDEGYEVIALRSTVGALLEVPGRKYREWQRVDKDSLPDMGAVPELYGADEELVRAYEVSLH